MKKYLFVVVAILLVVCMVGLTACKKDKPQGGDNVIEQPGDNPGGNTDPQDPGETTDPDQPGDNPGDQPGDNPGDNPGDQPGDEPDGPDNPDDPGEEPGEDAYIVSAEKYAEALSFYQKNFNLYATGNGDDAYTQYVTSLADGSVLARLVVEDEQDQWLAIRPQEDGTLDVYSGIQSADDDTLVVWNKGENYSVQDYFGGNMYMDLVGLFPLIDAVPFDDLTYDVIRNAYLGTINVDGDLVSVEFMFEDGLLQSAEFRLGEITVDVLFNYGDATIDSWYGLGRVILDDDAIASIVSDLADCLNVTAKVDINDKENEKRITYDVFKIDGSESEGFLRAQTDDVYYQYMDEMLYRIRYSTISERWIGELTEEGDSLGVCDILGRLLSAADGFTYDKQHDIYRYGHSGGEGFIRIEEGVIVEYYFRSSALDIDAELWDYGKTQVELPQYDILYSESEVLAICDKIPTSGTLNQYNYQNDALKSVTTFYFDDFSLNSDHTDVLSAKVKAYIEDNEAYFIVEGGKQLILNKVNGSWVAEDSNFPLYSIVEYKDIRQAITDYELIRFGSFRKQNDNTFYCFFEGNGPVSITVGILHGYVSLFELYNTEDGTLQRCEYSDINDTDLQLPEYTVK